MMSTTYDIGTVLPDLVVTDSDNMPSSLTRQMGSRGLLLYVLRGTWCPFCVKEITKMRRRYNSYNDVGVKTVFIVPEPISNVYSFAVSSPNPLPFGLHADEDTQIADALTVPVNDPNERPIGIYLLSPQREVVWRYVGYEDQNYPTQTSILRIINDGL